MRCFAILLIVFLSCLSESSTSEFININGKKFNKNFQLEAETETPEQWYYQCYDHFTSGCCDTRWNQRFWVNSNYYKAGGPIFLMFGGEDFSVNGSTTASMIDNFGYEWLWYGYQYGAIMVVLEHRFYGKSFPNQGSTANDLRILTSHQALADANEFLTSFRANYSLKGTKTVAFGGSYPGNLAAWFKYVYPSQVTTVVSSSAPLQAKYDFQEYMRTVSEVTFYEGGAQCFTNVQSAFSCAESLVHGTGCTNYQNSSQVPPAMRQCGGCDFNDRLSSEYFFNSIGYGPWASNYPTYNSVKNCQQFNSINGSNAMDTYGQFLAMSGHGNNNCGPKTRGVSSSGKSSSNVFDEEVKFIRSRLGAAAGALAWSWQTCNEFAYFQTADQKYQTYGYGWTPFYWAYFCKQSFGVEFSEAKIQANVDKTNQYYQGKNLPVRCVIFVNGQYDPWHPLGINDANETSNANTVVSIPKAEHCGDMGHSTDPNSYVGQAQTRIMKQIGIYLNDTSCNTVL